MTEPNAVVIRPDGTYDEIEVPDPQAEANRLLGPVDIFTCPDRVHVGAVGEHSLLDAEVLNLRAWYCYGRTELCGVAVIWRDDNQPLTADFRNFIAQLHGADNPVEALNIARQHWNEQAG